MRILGIDPGSRITGYGFIDTSVNKSHYVHSGCIRVSGDSLADKLGVIFREVRALVQEYNPHELAVEQVFVAHNASSALKLGHARGAAICAGVDLGLPVSEYSPRSIKQALAGNGNAAKEQVEFMVRRLLLVAEKLQADAADALAVALCHAHTAATLRKIPPAITGRK